MFGILEFLLKTFIMFEQENLFLLEQKMYDLLPSFFPNLTSTQRVREVYVLFDFITACCSTPPTVVSCNIWFAPSNTPSPCSRVTINIFDNAAFCFTIAHICLKTLLGTPHQSVICHLLFPSSLLTYNRKSDPDSPQSTLTRFPIDPPGIGRGAALSSY